MSDPRLEQTLKALVDSGRPLDALTAGVILAKIDQAETERDQAMGDTGVRVVHQAIADRKILEARIAELEGERNRLAKRVKEQNEVILTGRAQYAAQALKADGATKNWEKAAALACLGPNSHEEYNDVVRQAEKFADRIVELEGKLREPSEAISRYFQLLDEAEAISEGKRTPRDGCAEEYQAAEAALRAAGRAAL